MLTKKGQLFHIDFGHFLGNFKKKYGFKRERAKFVLTPDFVHVMGGQKSENFQIFIELCCTAFNILRKHSNRFINLFAMVRLYARERCGPGGEDIRVRRWAVACSRALWAGRAACRLECSPPSYRCSQLGSRS